MEKGLCFTGITISDICLNGEVLCVNILKISYVCLIIKYVLTFPSAGIAMSDIMEKFFVSIFLCLSHH